MRKIFLFIFLAVIAANSEALPLQQKGNVIKGRIYDESGNPMSGAGIIIEGTYLGVYSDNEGYYSLSGLKDGTYKLRFSFTGYEPEVKELMLSGDIELNAVLVSAIRVTGEVIINATRAGNRTPLAYSTIDAGFISKHNAGQDIPYLLSLTPSLVETSEAGTGIGYTNLRIRGTDASRINVTLDGIPLNNPESQQVFWVDIPDLASSVENIQVQRGAGTSSNGAGAFGATVSIQSKNPENEPFAQISSLYGSFNTFRKMVSAGTGLLADRFALQIRLSDLKSDGYIRRTGSDHRSAFLNGIYRTERSLLKANVILGEEHTGIGWWGVPEEMINIDRRYNPSGEYTDNTGATRHYENESDNYIQNHYQLIYSFKPARNISLSTALHYTRGIGYYEEYKEDRILSEFGLPDVDMGGMVFTESDLIRRKWMSNDFYGAIYSLRYNNNRIALTFGGSGNNYSGDHYGRIIWMSIPGDTERDYEWYRNRGDKGEISFFGKADYSVTGKISLFGDLQYRYISYNMRGYDDDLKDIGQDHNFNFFNPKAGVFISVSPNQDAYASISVANREPARADFKEAAGDPGATPRAETLYDVELGYHLRGSNYSLSANLYGMFYKDQLVPTGELSSVGYPIMTNVKDSYRIGAEINAAIRPAEFMSWDFNVTLSRNKIKNFIEYYTDYNTEDWSQEYKNKSLGRVDIAYSPSLTGSSDLRFTILRNVDLHLISKLVGKQYFDNTMNPERMLDQYFINNVRIDFTPEIRKIKNSEFSIHINNLFNTMYESNAYGGTWYEDGVEKSWSYFFPQAGINFMLKTSLTF